MNEAFENSVGTQRSDMGLFKKFALNLTTVALPNLIANDLVIVHPMSSMSGYINYIEYQFASNKGDVKIGDKISNPWEFGDAHPDFTANRVVENLDTKGATEDYYLAWNPVCKDREGKAVVEVMLDGAWTRVAEELLIVDEKGVALKKDSFADGTRIRYCYDNVVIPQHDLPMVKAEMKSIALVARARRVAVYFSQIAAYQAKTDYGIDLGDQLAEKAVGELAYKL